LNSLTKNSKRGGDIDIFNILRGIAILFIFLPHYIIAQKYFNISQIFIYPLDGLSWAGVWIFFILSGYLIGKNFYNGRYSTDSHGILKFYGKRFLRIAPIYIIFLLASFLINPQWFLAIPVYSVLQMLTFTYNAIPSCYGTVVIWFISAIMQMYFFAPFLYKFIIGKTQIKPFVLLIIIIISGVSLRIAESLLNMDFWIFTYTNAFSNLDLFLAGMLLNKITCNPDSRIKEKLRLFSIPLLIAVSFFFVLVTNLFIIQYILPTVILISVLGIIYAYDYKNCPKVQYPAIRNIIKNPVRIIETIGMISFILYLSEYYLLFALFRFISSEKIILGQYELLGISFVFCVVSSAIIYLITEYPLEKLRNSFRYKIYSND